MRFLLPLLLILLCVAALLPGCEPKEDIVTKDPKASLEFSLDTVKFDTVFVQTRTVTKRLWVYNRNARAVRVEQVSLANPGGSPYSLIVNGDAGASASNLEIRGKDSLLVLVRATIDPTPSDAKPFLIEDRLQFRTNGNDQNVKLIAYGQNAYFHEGVLPCNAVWRNDKPHVILNSVLVDSTCTLTLEPGTRVYAHAGSGLVVKGRLLVNAAFAPGTAPVPATDRGLVRFSGDRREKFYDEIPGQWRGIQFEPSSHGNVVRYAEIKNAGFGLLVFNPRNRQPRPDVKVDNTVIRNISGAALSFASAAGTGGGSFDGGGILSFSGKFDLTNCLITNCGEFALFGSGTDFALNFCTIANYTPLFSRKTPSVAFTNVPLDVKRFPLAAPISVRLTVRNSILWGSGTTPPSPDEIVLDHAPEYAPQISIQNSLLRTELYKSQLTGSSNLILQTDEHLFKQPGNGGVPASKISYQLDTLSPASNKARFDPQVPRDLLNAARSTSGPDIGAYERVNP